MYSDTDLSCQEESDISEKKNEISMPEAEKLECVEASARIIPRPPLGTEQPSSRQEGNYGLISAASSSENPSYGVVDWSQSPTGYA
jgi:hypothetical protein